MLKKIKSGAHRFGGALKVVGYDLPKTIIKRSFTNANITDHFPKGVAPRKKR